MRSWWTKVGWGCVALTPSATTPSAPSTAPVNRASSQITAMAPTAKVGLTWCSLRYNISKVILLPYVLLKIMTIITFLPFFVWNLQIIVWLCRLREENFSSSLVTFNYVRKQCLKNYQRKYFAQKLRELKGRKASKNKRSKCFLSSFSQIWTNVRYLVIWLCVERTRHVSTLRGAMTVSVTWGSTRHSKHTQTALVSRRNSLALILFIVSLFKEFFKSKNWTFLRALNVAKPLDLNREPFMTYTIFTNFRCSQFSFSKTLRKL